MTDAEGEQLTMRHYSARRAYNSESAEDYEKTRFSGVLGRYRWEREQKAVRELLKEIEPQSIIADIPCGIGRWWPLLSTRASRIVGVDVSPAMLEKAECRAQSAAVPTELHLGDAEAIPLEDLSVDYVFSFALTKHLPLAIQMRVLSEFAIVSRIGVITTCSIVTSGNYEFWRRRHLVESFPLIREQVADICADYDLRVEKCLKCTSPLGVERLFYLSKASGGSLSGESPALLGGD